MKSPLVLVFVACLGALIVYAIWLGTGSAGSQQAQPSGAPAVYCADGQTQQCTAGACSGVSTCIGGVWSGCKWPTSCIPGARVPCLSNGCVYAVKECNSCGTGYGECFLPNATAPAPPQP